MYFAHRFNALHKYPLLFKNISTVSDIKKRIKKKNKEDAGELLKINFCQF